MQPLLRFFQTAEDPDLDPRIVVEHLEHPREAELNRSTSCVIAFSSAGSKDPDRRA
jgi:hypothetical protein